MDAGRGAGSAGSVFIGATNAATVRVGSSASTTFLDSLTTQVNGDLVLSSTSRIVPATGSTVLIGAENNTEVVLSRPTRATLNTDGGAIRLQGGTGSGTGVNGNVSVGAPLRATPQVMVTGQQLVLDGGSSVNLSSPAVTIGTAGSTVTINGTVVFIHFSSFFFFLAHALPPLFTAQHCVWLPIQWHATCGECCDFNLSEQRFVVDTHQRHHHHWR